MLLPAGRVRNMQFKNVKILSKSLDHMGRGLKVLINNLLNTWDIYLYAIFYSLVYKRGKFPDGYPGFIFGDGDGTVNQRSLEGCLKWSGKQKQKIYHQTFPNMDHMDVLSDDRIVKYITSYISDKV